MSWLLVPGILKRPPRTVSFPRLKVHHFKNALWRSLLYLIFYEPLLKMETLSGDENLVVPEWMPVRSDPRQHMHHCCFPSCTAGPWLSKVPIAADRKRSGQCLPDIMAGNNFFSHKQSCFCPSRKHHHLATQLLLWPNTEKRQQKHERGCRSPSLFY